jgi:hypothetical protein
MPMKYAELYELLRKSTARIPGDKLLEIVYADKLAADLDVEWNTFQKYMSNFSKWANREHGKIAQSTTGYYLDDAAVVEPYRRVPKRFRNS